MLPWFSWLSRQSNTLKVLRFESGRRQALVIRFAVFLTFVLRPFHHVKSMGPVICYDLDSAQTWHMGT